MSWGKQYEAQFKDPELDRLVNPVPKRGYSLPPAPELRPPSCLACGNFRPPKVCGRCRVALFCDEICQRRVWPDHKLRCEPPDVVLAKIRDEPADPEQQAQADDPASQAAELARSMAAFFARGGPKAQTPGGGTAAPGGASADAEAKRPEWLRRRGAAGGEAGGAAAGGGASAAPPAPAAGAAAAGAPAAAPPAGAATAERAREAPAGAGAAAGGLPADRPGASPTPPAGGARGRRCAPPEQAQPHPAPQTPSGGASASDCRGGSVQLPTGARMPRIALGTAGHGGLAGKDGRAAIFAALRLGYRALDTAEMNRNLLDIAWACRKSGVPREELFVIAKIAPWHYGYEQTQKALARQLDELRLEYVDLLLLQWPYVWEPEQRQWSGDQWRNATHWGATIKKGSWRALEELYNRGKARAIGVSNFDIVQLQGLLQWSNVKPHVLQAESNPHWSNAGLQKWCNEMGIIFQGYAPLGGQLDDNNRGKRAVEMDVIKEIAERNGATQAQVCLHWNLARNDATVVKSKTPRYLRENLSAAAVQVRSSDLAAIDQVGVAMAEYGPCYWGRSDTDLANPFRDGDRLEQEMAASLDASMGSAATLDGPPTRRREPQRDAGWVPQPPPGSAAPRR